MKNTLYWALETIELNDEEVSELLAAGVIERCDDERVHPWEGQTFHPAGYAPGASDKGDENHRKVKELLSIDESRIVRS
jgi:hypothetical protein